MLSRIVFAGCSKNRHLLAKRAMPQVQIWICEVFMCLSMLSAPSGHPPPASNYSRLSEPSSGVVWYLAVQAIAFEGIDFIVAEPAVLVTDHFQHKGLPLIGIDIHMAG